MQDRNVSQGRVGRLYMDDKSVYSGRTRGIFLSIALRVILELQPCKSAARVRIPVAADCHTKMYSINGAYRARLCMAA